MISYLKEKKYDKLTELYIQNTPYTLIQKLGEGSYGVAYLLQHQQTKQQIVLKRLKANQLKKLTLKCFEQEMALLQQLSHLPIPQFIQTGFIEEAPYFLMSYVTGDTFEQAIFEHNQTYTISETIAITKKLLQIVHALHEENIVHRDLRIPNIIIENEQLQIIDFGLASTIDENFTPQTTSNPKKAPHPMSDLYAVGHFMLFLLYSKYEHNTKKSSTWQQELQLPAPLQRYIERLLTIKAPFHNTSEALDALQLLNEAGTKQKYNFSQ